MSAIQAEDVINALNNPDDDVNIRVFDDHRPKVFNGAKYTVKAKDFSTIKEALKKHNDAGRAISLVINTGGNTDAEITRINAQFMECDDLPMEEQEKAIKAFPLRPSMIIKTRKSLHTYWFVKDADVSLFRPIQKALALHFNGDSNMVNESRAMRLPGFYHCKQEPILVQCIYWHPERRYTQQQLMDVLPMDQVHVQPRAEKQNTKITGDEMGLELVLNTCDFLKHCKKDAATLPESDWYAMITNLANFRGGAEAIHSLSAGYPTYNKEETENKIQHFLESGTGPMTCAAIAEKGFKCPKLKDGTCPCKAPAAKVYRPMEIEEYEAMIKALPITNDAATDTKTARKFVEDYLLNTDQSTVMMLLNYTMKQHFKFKNEDLKMLMSSYRKVHKEFAAQNDKHSKIPDGLVSLPKWYTTTKNGLKFMPYVLAEELSKDEHVFYAAEQHYRYTHGVYEPIPVMEAQHIVQEKMLPTEAKWTQITDAEKQWRIKIQKGLREINPNVYMINVQNGFYNVLEDTLTEHTPEYLSTIQLNVRYDPKADCPKFKKFLNDSMEGDEGQVKLIQEMLGYCLIPSANAQKAFVLTGAAAAGKSVLLNVISDILLSRQNVSNVSWQALNERFKPAELFGKLANIFADLPTKNIDDNGIFKALVGEDTMTVEKKNKDPFSFKSTARLLFSCNSIPRNYGDRSEGFYRRLIIIRFNHSVPQEKRDPFLLDKFRGEADGIFQFALDGLRTLIKNDFKFDVTDKNQKEVEQYKEDSDSVLAFAAECCEVEEGASVGSTELFNHYKNYCEENGMKPYAMRNFIRAILERYPNSKRAKDHVGNRRIITNLKYVEDKDWNEDSNS